MPWSDDHSEYPFSLTITLDKEVYQPGESVIATVTLRNDTKSSRTISLPNYSSMSFMTVPKGMEGTNREQQIIPPVYSVKEPAGTLVDIGGQQEFKRPFVFTRLTFERGEFALHGIYSTQNEDDSRLMRRAYSLPCYYKVEGEHVFAERYVNGLISKAFAEELVANQVPGSLIGSDAILIQDEAGFLKWWVNTEFNNWKGGQGTRSWFVDPYRATVWREARPFTPKDRLHESMELPRNSAVVDKLRRRRGF